MRELLINLKDSDKQFIRAHLELACEHPQPTDSILAARLNISDRSVRMRRAKLKRMGVPIRPLQKPGFIEPYNPRQGYLFAGN